jgi:hypothetical protein
LKGGDFHHQNHQGYAGIKGMLLTRRKKKKYSHRENGIIFHLSTVVNDNRNIESLIFSFYSTAAAALLSMYMPILDCSFLF